MVSEIITSIFGDLTPIATMIILAIGALISPGIMMFGKNHNITWAVALILSVVAMLVDICLLVDDYSGSYLGVSVGTYSLLMALLFMIVLTIVIFVSNSSVETSKRHAGAYYALLFGASLGMVFVTASSDLLTIFVGVELTSISSYALVALKRRDGRASEAAVKYAIIGGMSTALTLYGISMIYGLSGSIEISDIAGYVQYSGES